MRRAVLLVASAMLATTACTSDGPARDEARLVPEGVVHVSEAGGPWQAVGSPRTLSAGDRVRVRRGGAVLELAGGGRLGLRRASEVRVGAVPALLDGDLLVEVGRRPLAVDAEGTRVSLSEGAARLSRSLALTAAAYRGSVDLRGAGRTLSVPALRQAVVPAAGLVPTRPSPLRYDERDEWDRQFLGDAIELGRELEAKSRGFTSQLRQGEATDGFFRTVLPALADEPAFGAHLVEAARSPGETLVGATIAAHGRRGAFAARWSAVFAFRDAGAEWGLVALDQQVERDPLVSEIDAAIGRSAPELVFAAPAPSTPILPPPTAAGPSSTGPPSPTTSSPGPTSPPPTQPPPTTTTTTLVPPLPTIPAGPAPDGVPADPVTRVVDELLGGLTGS